MQPNTDIELIVSERPISGISEDRLGLDVLADSMAHTLLRQTPGDGFVVGVLGAWGSGKSSLLNLVEKRLGPANPSEGILGAGQPIVRRFNPWLVGTREALLPELFDVLVRGFEDTYDPKNGVIDNAKVKIAKLRRELEKYASLLEMAAKAATSIEKPLHLDGLSALLRGAHAFAKKREISLASQKNTVNALLREAPRRVVILVDDLDRLEPKEAVEVLRLVKAVADFPNTIYVLAYAPDLLANAVERQLAVPNGYSFLEKMVQISYTIPPPDDYDLRSWLRESLDTIIAGVFNQTLIPAYKDRLAQLLSTDAERLLRTPRDVVRIANAFRVAWPPVAKSVDIVDFVWLTLNRIKRPSLYEWLRDYCAENSQIDLGMTLDDEVARDLEKRLHALADAADGFDTELARLRSIFPDIGASKKKSARGEVLDLFPQQDALKLLLRRDKRLASGHYARFYFAQKNAAGAFSPKDEVGLDEALRSPQKLTGFLEAMTAIARPQGGNMGAYTIDTLLQRFEQLGQPVRASIATASAEIMDDLVRGQPFDQINQWRAWESGSTLFRQIISGVKDEDARHDLIRTCFGMGAARCWLVRTAVNMAETARKDASADRFALQADAAAAAAALSPRLEDQPLDQVPSILNFLWSWRRLGQRKSARAWAQRQMERDADLLMLVEGLRGWSASAAGIDRPFNTKEIVPFIDLALVRTRLGEISSSGEPEASKAKILLSALGEAHDEIEPNRDIFSSAFTEQFGTKSSPEDSDDPLDVSANGTDSDGGGVTESYEIPSA